MPDEGYCGTLRSDLRRLLRYVVWPLQVRLLPQGFACKHLAATATRSRLFRQRPTCPMTHALTHSHHRALLPKLREVALEYADVRFIKVDVDELEVSCRCP